MVKVTRGVQQGSTLGPLLFVFCRRGEELGICQSVTVIIIPAFVSTPPSLMFSAPLFPSPPPPQHPLSVSVLVSYLCPGWVFMVQGFYLPKVTPLWRHEARQHGGGKKISLKKGSSLVNYTLSKLRHRIYNCTGRASSDLENCSTSFTFLRASSVFWHLLKKKDRKTSKQPMILKSSAGKTTSRQNNVLVLVNALYCGDCEERETGHIRPQTACISTTMTPSWPSGKPAKPLQFNCLIWGSDRNWILY